MVKAGVDSTIRLEELRASSCGFIVEKYLLGALTIGGDFRGDSESYRRRPIAWCCEC